MTTSVTRSRTGRLLLAVAAIGVVNITDAPSALAEPLATCTSDVIGGVEVDYCVGNPNANIVTEVPGVNTEFEFGLGIGLGF
ncbi:MAG: hypothetical protein JWR11_1476 [Mycobacterium sp.]|nr:hypothetical protein [Mycobacterium sp.]